MFVIRVTFATNSITMIRTNRGRREEESKYDRAAILMTAEPIVPPIRRVVGSRPFEWNN